MRKKIGKFLVSRTMIVVLFLVLLLASPVFYVYSEPLRTNYLPGEKQDWIVKTKWYPGVVKEYLFHTEGEIDVFFGILARNYVSNQIGILLLGLYYLLASVIHRLFQNIKPKVDSTEKTREIKKNLIMDEDKFHPGFAQTSGTFEDIQTLR